jgi:hypothetical protein
VAGDIEPRVLHPDGIVRRVLIVLAHEHDRQLPQRRDVQRLVELALRGGAVAEEAGGHAALALDLGGERRAAGDGQPPAHDAVRAQHAHREVGDVHGAALPLGVAVHAAEELGHHAPDVGALGDAVAVAAVGARHAVPGREARADADGHRLLADVGMHGPVDLAGDAELDGALVELADQDHGAEHPDELRCLERHGSTSTEDEPTRHCRPPGAGPPGRRRPATLRLILASGPRPAA